MLGDDHNGRTRAVILVHCPECGYTSRQSCPDCATGAVQAHNTSPECRARLIPERPVMPANDRRTQRITGGW